MSDSLSDQIRKQAKSKISKRSPMKEKIGIREEFTYEIHPVDENNET